MLQRCQANNQVIVRQIVQKSGLTNVPVPIIAFKVLLSSSQQRAGEINTTVIPGPAYVCLEIGRNGLRRNRRQAPGFRPEQMAAARQTLAEASHGFGQTVPTPFRKILDLNQPVVQRLRCP